MKTLALTCLIAAGTLALAACSTQPEQNASSQQKTAQNKDTRTVCTSKTPTGSHLSKTRCVTMTPEQYKEYKNALQERKKKSREAMRNAELHSNQGRGGPF